MVMSRCLALGLLFLCAVVTPLSAVEPSMATASTRARILQDTASPGVDLAALALRPTDVAQPGWSHEGAFMEDLASEAGIVADYRAGTVAPDEVAKQLTTFGWQRMYVNVLGFSADGGSAPSQRVRSYVTEFASAEGAATGFAFLEDEGAAAAADDIPTTRQFGEQSELTSEQGISEVDGRPFRSLDLTFRVGNLTAGVTLIVYRAGPEGAPDLAVVETLGEVLESRLLAPAVDGMGLGTTIARFGGDRHEVTTYDDAYYRIAGNDIPLADEAAEDAERRVDTYADATDVYQIWQGIDVGSADGVLYGVTALRFPDEAAATAWMGSLQAMLGENPFYGGLQPVEVADSTHQTVALRYVSGGGSPDAPHAMLVAVRVGAVVARVHLVPQGRLSDIALADVQPLAEIGATCVADDACPELTELPTTSPSDVDATPDPFE
jgi:hypothetical protein